MFRILVCCTGRLINRSVLHWIFDRNGTAPLLSPGYSHGYNRERPPRRHHYGASTVSRDETVTHRHLNTRRCPKLSMVEERPSEKNNFTEQRFALRG